MALNWIDYVTIVCIILCFLIIGYQLYQHLRNFNIPAFQGKIILILLMPPLYEVLSSVSIWFNDSNGYLLLVRDIYESIVIFAFYRLLTCYIAFEPLNNHVSYRKICEILVSKGPTHPHSWPFSYCLKPLDLSSVAEARKRFRYCTVGILQYIPIKIVLAVLIFIAEFSSGQGVLYYICSGVEFAAVCLALYWLVFFYHIFSEELKPYRPLLKFATVKIIIAVMFWQEEVLDYCQVSLSSSRYVPPSDRASADTVLSSLLVDIEMVLMSIATSIAFSYKDFELSEKTNVSLSHVIKENTREIWRDLTGMMGLQKKETFEEKPEDHIAVKIEDSGEGSNHSDHRAPEKAVEMTQGSSNIELKPNARMEIKNGLRPNQNQVLSPESSIPGQLIEENSVIHKNTTARFPNGESVTSEQMRVPEDYSRDMRERNTLQHADEEITHIMPRRTPMQSGKKVINA